MLYLTRDYIANRIQIDTNSGCWNWLPYKNEKGYGICRHLGKLVKAHRLSYEVFTNRVIKHTINHICENKSCVNPSHLEDVTNKENVRKARGYYIHNDEWYCRNNHKMNAENIYFIGKGEMCLQCRQYYRQGRWLLYRKITEAR